MGLLRKFTAAYTVNAGTGMVGSLVLQVIKKRSGRGVYLIAAAVMGALLGVLGVYVDEAFGIDD